MGRFLLGHPGVPTSHLVCDVLECRSRLLLLTEDHGCHQLLRPENRLKVRYALRCFNLLRFYRGELRKAAVKIVLFGFVHRVRRYWRVMVLLRRRVLCGVCQYGQRLVDYLLRWRLSHLRKPLNPEEIVRGSATPGGVVVRRLETPLASIELRADLPRTLRSLHAHPCVGGEWQP